MSTLKNGKFTAIPEVLLLQESPPSIRTARAIGAGTREGLTRYSDGRFARYRASADRCTSSPRIALERSGGWRERTFHANRANSLPPGGSSIGALAQPHRRPPADRMARCGSGSTTRSCESTRRTRRYGGSGCSGRQVKSIEQESPRNDLDRVRWWWHRPVSPRQHRDVSNAEGLLGKDITEMVEDSEEAVDRDRQRRIEPASHVAVRDGRIREGLPAS